MNITIVNEATTLNFLAWNGRPQLARKVIEVYTRLGSATPIIQTLKSESIVTTSTAYMFDATAVAAEIKVASLRSLIGLDCTWTDESGIAYSKFRVTDFTYAINKTETGFLTTFTISSIVDGVEEL
jgi:hypothetical protein